MENSNYLYGKKYVALGDSYTSGDFNGFQEISGIENVENPYVYDKEMKMIKTYPWWIAKRNGMELVNLAHGGGTLTYMPEVGPAGDSYSLSTIYKKVPLDADYITIWIGINDTHKKAPLGSVTDDTLTTFCGAWNVVLRYLITNLPYAKIGIIATTSGASPAYHDMTLKMARRWGIPYLDLNDDYLTPVLNNVRGRPEMCNEVRAFRTEKFSVTPKNRHPNIEAYKYISTAIEKFMRSL